VDRDLTSRREFLRMLLSLMAYSKKNKKDFQKTVTPDGFQAFVQIT